MNIQVIIPAHLNSIRLKRKVLIDINGLPMIEHVRRRVLLSKSINKVHVATGDIEKFGPLVIAKLPLIMPKVNKFWEIENCPS